MEDVKDSLSDIIWAGSSLKDLKGFPDKVRSHFGYSLFRLQQGEVPTRSYKPMSDIETGVYELREQDSKSWYRVIYYTRIEDHLVVLHCFEKRSAKTPKSDIQIAKDRLSQVKNKRRK